MRLLETTAQNTRVVKTLQRLLQKRKLEIKNDRVLRLRRFINIEAALIYMRDEIASMKCENCEKKNESFFYALRAIRFFTIAAAIVTTIRKNESVLLRLIRVRKIVYFIACDIYD